MAKINIDPVKFQPAHISERGNRQKLAAQASALREQAQVPSGYGKGAIPAKDLNPQDHPYAISHDMGYHDSLTSHISELRSRIDTLGLQGPHLAKKLAPAQAHLHAAEGEVNNSYSAHKAGLSSGVSAIHTANVSYMNAVNHITDAHRVLVSQLGIKSQHLQTLGRDDATTADKKPMWTGKLLTNLQLSNLANEYQEHLKSRSLNHKVQLPKGVLTESTPNTDPTSRLSSAGQRITPRLVEKTPEQKIETQVEKTRGAMSSIRERAMKMGATFTAERAARAREAMLEGAPKPPKETAGAYSGVGVSGINDIAQAAARHYEFQNPGQSFWHSEHTKSPETVMDYAVKHKVGVPNNYEAVLAKTMRMTNLTPTQTTGDVAAELKSEKYKEKPIEPSAVVEAVAKRSGEFNTGRTK